jgi:PST family polysaccharide transporter
MNQRILKKIKAFKQSKLITTSLKNSIQVIIRFVLGFLNIKVVALFVGPTGMALVSQLQSSLQIGSSLAGLGINNGVVRFLSQFKYSTKRQDLILATSFLSVLVASLFLGLLIYLFPKFISNLIFNTPEYFQITRYSGIFFFTTSFLRLFLAYLNGTENLKQYVTYNILITFSSFITSFIAVYFWGIQGLLWSQIFLSSIAFCFVFITVRKRLKLKDLSFSFLMLKRLSNYSLMAITSSVLSPLTSFIIRKIIASDLSWDMAGFWDGINKVSNNYIMLITSSFIFYFLPAFSQLKNNNEIRKEIHSTFKNLIPVLILGALIILFSRHLIIRILFSESFTSMSELFLWQVIGDYFKIMSWVIGYLFIAKEKVKTYIVTEFVSMLLQIALAKAFIAMNSNLTMYYGIENILYFCIMYLCYNWHFKRAKTSLI